MRVLIVTTNSRGEGEIYNSGVWLEEYAVPYLVFASSGLDITTASPEGGLSPVDEESLSCSNPSEWDECVKILRNTKKLSEIDYENYDILYLPGGHGPMFDLAKDTTLKKVVGGFYGENKIISAVCHGPAGLVSAVDANGDSILKGKKVTSFTNKEEKIKKTDEAVPFLLESRIKELGANFIEAAPWSEHVEVDCKIITGQNPQSSLKTAEEVLKLI